MQFVIYIEKEDQRYIEHSCESYFWLDMDF